MPPTHLPPENSRNQYPGPSAGADEKSVGDDQGALPKAGTTSTTGTGSWTEFFEMLDRAGGVSEDFMEYREQVIGDRHLFDSLFDEREED